MCWHRYPGPKSSTEVPPLCRVQWGGVVVTRPGPVYRFCLMHGYVGRSAQKGFEVEARQLAPEGQCQLGGAPHLLGLRGGARDCRRRRTTGSTTWYRHALARLWYIHKHHMLGHIMQYVHLWLMLWGQQYTRRKKMLQCVDEIIIAKKKIPGSNHFKTVRAMFIRTTCNNCVWLHNMMKNYLIWQILWHVEILHKMITFNQFFMTTQVMTKLTV